MVRMVWCEGSNLAGASGVPPLPMISTSSTTLAVRGEYRWVGDATPGGK